MNDIEQIEISIEAARSDVEKMKCLLRLVNNIDFKTIIDDGYFVTEASRLVLLRADPDMMDEVSQNTVNNRITAVGFFRQYLQGVMQMGRMAEQGIREDELTREELLAEDL
jgi:hypothetical protein